jgi:hypothetical protein
MTTMPHRPNPQASSSGSASIHVAARRRVPTRQPRHSAQAGADLGDPGTWQGVGFQPPFAKALEFAFGLISLVGVAADYREP